MWYYDDRSHWNWRRGPSLFHHVLRRRFWRAWHAPRNANAVGFEDQGLLSCVESPLECLSERPSKRPEITRFTRLAITPQSGR